MALRSTMAALIYRVRLMVNDPNALVWSDAMIQDVLDESRQNINYTALQPSPTYSGSTVAYLDYYSDVGGWEDDYVLKQYLTMTVTPSSVEPIAGHFVFSTTTLPPVYISGKLFDVWRAAADLLERQAAQWALSYTINVDGQSMARSQVLPALLSLAKTYRAKQRATSLTLGRSDLSGAGGSGLSLGPQEIDYISSGNGR